MPSTMPLRVGDDLLASARLAADATGRSAAQQIGHWAKLGRELERSGSVSVREIAAVLIGARRYDDLNPKAQAIVRAEWEEGIEARRKALDLVEQFTAEGRSWVEAGPDGAAVRRTAAGRMPERRSARKPSARTKGRTTSGSPASAEKKARDDKTATHGRSSARTG